MAETSEVPSPSAPRRLRTFLTQTAARLSTATPWATRYRREALLSSFTGILLIVLSLLTAPLLARALGPEGRGDLAAVLMPMIVLSWLLSWGFPVAAAYFADVLPERTILSTVTVFGLLTGGPICVGIWFLLPTYLEGHSQTALIWARVTLVAVPLSMGINAALEIRRRRGAGTSWNRWRSAPIVVSAIGILALAAIGRLTLQSALACYFVGGSVPIVLLFARLVRGDGGGPSTAALRRLLPYASRSAVVIGTNSATVRLDQVVLAAAVPAGQLGLYAVAVTASAASGPLTSGLSLALFGHQRSDGVSRRASDRYRRTVVLTLFVSCLTAATVAVVVPVLLPLAFGTEFVGAVRPLWVLLPGQVATDLLGVFTTGLYADNRPAEAMRAGIFGAVVTVAGLLVLVPRFGIMGAAATTSMAFIAQVVFLISRGVLRRSPQTLADADPVAELRQ